jgi:predicted peroxiredoxin
MKTLYFCSTGSSDPTGASIPLHVAANGSIVVGHDVAVVLGGDATELLSEETANGIEGVGVPPLRELLAKLGDNQVPVYV